VNAAAPVSDVVTAENGNAAVCARDVAWEHGESIDADAITVSDANDVGDVEWRRLASRAASIDTESLESRYGASFFE
jgi:hypothetical protein